MISKWIILDEIKLELLKIGTSTQKCIAICDSKEIAIRTAEKCIDAWQVIEIPYGDC